MTTAEVLLRAAEKMVRRTSVKKRRFCGCCWCIRQSTPCKQKQEAAIKVLNMFAPPGLGESSYCWYWWPFTKEGTEARVIALCMAAAMEEAT